MKKSKFNPRDPADPLQAQLRVLVAQLHAHTEAAPEIFRQFCRLARAHELDPEDFRQRLVQAGLTYSRVSELKTVLASNGHCTAFLLPPGDSGRESWRTALKEARCEKIRNETGQTALQQLAARVAGLMHRTKQTSLPLLGGRLWLEPRAGDLESLS